MSVRTLNSGLDVINIIKNYNKQVDKIPITNSLLHCTHGWKSSAELWNLFKSRERNIFKQKELDESEVIDVRQLDNGT